MPRAKSSLPAPRGVVHDPGALRRAHFLPLEHPVLDPLLGRELVERPGVPDAHQVFAGQFLQDLEAAAQHREPVLYQVQYVIALPDLDVGHVRVHGRRDVCRQGPRCRRPDKQRAPRLGHRSVEDGKAHEHAGVHDLLVALRHDLVLRQAGAAPGTPRHHVRSLVDPAAPVTLLEEVPDRVVILVRHRVVGVVPVHPVPEPDRLARDRVGEPPDPRLAKLHEPVDAVLLDLALRLEAQVLLHLDLDPEPLAVEPVLVPLPVALHRPVAQEEVLVRPAPSVVDAHGVVGGDGPVDEGVPGGGAVVSAPVLAWDVVLIPPRQHLLLKGREIDLRLNRTEHRLLSCCALPGSGRTGRRSQNRSSRPSRDGSFFPRCHPSSPAPVSRRDTRYASQTDRCEAALSNGGRVRRSLLGQAARSGRGSGAIFTGGRRVPSHRAGLAVRRVAGYSSPS